MLKYILILVLLSGAAMAQDKVVYCVESQPDGSGWFIEPIATLHYGIFHSAVTKPKGEEARQASSRNGEFVAFTMDHFQPGTKYPLFRYNERIGMVKIDKPDTEYIGGSVTASVNIFTSGTQELSLGERGICIGDTLARDFSIRKRRATSDDTLTALRSAKAFLLSERIPKNIVERTQITRIHAVDLDGDGKAELVADGDAWQLMKTDGVEWERIYSLMFILKQKPDGSWDTLFRKYINQRDAESLMRQEIVDCTDLDGDGIPEVIIKNYYHDAADYTIIQKKEATWKDVFTGG